MNPAKRYAKALFDLSQENQKLEAVHSDLQTLENIIQSSKELNAFLQNPVISFHQREKILDSLFKNKISDLTHRFLNFLVQKKRINILLTICKGFEDLYLKNKNIARVNITSSGTISEGQVQAICQYLKTKLKKDIEATVDKNQSILGGLKIQIGDLIYDYSLRTQLDKFRENILHA